MESIASGHRLPGNVTAFSRQPALLEQSYLDLERQVERLTRQLDSEQSARVGAEQERLLTDKRLAHMLEALPGGVLLLDVAGRISRHNSAAAELLGRPLTGCRWASIVRRELAARQSEDGYLQLRDGRWLSLSRRPFDSAQGEILILADVSESRRLADMRERRKRLSAIGEMTAEFAHQVRTPLATAMLHASRIRRHEPEDEQTLGKLMASLNDLGRMVDDMLRYASGQALENDSVHVGELMRAAMRAMENSLSPTTRLRASLSEVNLQLLGNFDALKGALSNLINNANQAMTGPGHIILAARRVADTIELSVSDNGPGIADEVADRVFEPFFTTRPQGTGLGLAVVRSVVEAHAGEVEVSTSRFGSSFVIRIPERP